MENNKIRGFAVYGERGSGTRWVTSLIGNKYDIHNLTSSDISGWKHGMWNDRISQQLDHRTLIVVVQKDIFAWLVSFNQKPWEMPRTTHWHLSLSDFIRKEPENTIRDAMEAWRCDSVVGAPRTDDMNLDGTPFKNPIEMYYRKYKAWEQIDKTKHPVFYVDYAQALKSPRQFIWALEEEHQMPANKTKAHDVDRAYHKKDYYLNQEYLEFWSQEDILFVNEELERLKKEDS